MRLRIACLSFLLFSSNLFAQHTSSFERVLERYDALIDNEKYEEVLDLLIKKKVEFDKQPEQKAKLLLRMGDVYYNIQDPVSSTKYYTQALLVPNGLSDHERIIAYNIIGINHAGFDNTRKAIDAYRSAIALIPSAHQETGKEYEWLYNNIALEFVLNSQSDSAKYYHQLCLNIRLTQNNNLSLGQTYNNLGSLFHSNNEFDSAYYYFNKGLEYRKKAEKFSETAIIESRINIGKSLNALGKVQEAEVILTEQLTITQNKDYLILEQRALEELTSLYVKQGKYALALQTNQRYHTINDSLFSTEKRDKIIQLTVSKKFTEKAISDSISSAEKAKVEAEIQEEKDRTTFYIQLSLIIVVVFLGGIAFIIYRNYKSNQRFSEVILEQKEKVEAQKNTLAYANREVTDSINYAQRIQNAILPSKEQLLEKLNSHFLFYRPKAILAGDFYWTEEQNGTVYFAAADCTGHGVPGALVSVVCSNALQQSISVYGKTEPSAILAHTNQLVIEALAKHTDTIKDGMDISLCALNREKGRLLFSGANNPVYIIREYFENSELIQNDTHELLEIKGTKQGIGFSETQKPFEQHAVNVSAGDLIVVFTDGFADQFGGENGKKYKYRPFKQFLLKIISLSSEEQAIAINKEFEEWKGSEEQVDDVCVIGVRV